MSVLWRHKTLGRLYEVRKAGETLRLYTNGAFHSAQNQNHLFTGAVWDLLTLPALYSNDHLRHALMLGVGGGTAINQLNRLLNLNEIVGLELDPVHLKIARKFFKVDADNVTLIEANAIDFMRSNKRKFDLVIDDIFLDALGDPERPTAVDEVWFRKLASSTSARGLMVQNHLSPDIATEIIDRNRTFLTRQFNSALLFETPKYENGIIAFFRKPVTRSTSDIVASIHAFDAPSSRRLRFTCTKIF